MYQTWTEYAQARQPEVNAILRAVDRVERAKTDKARKRALNALLRLTTEEEYTYFVEYLEQRR
jgi:hypothetical protein